MNIILIILISLNVFLTIQLLAGIKKNYRYKMQYKYLQDELADRDNTIRNLRMETWMHNYTTPRKEIKIVREVPVGTLDAIKIAMKVSHPDNGGKAEDFIKYRRAYNIITGKEKA